MACEVKSTEIVLEAAMVSYGKEEQTCVELIAGLTGGEYFNVSSVDTDYYIWIDLDDSSLDPAPAGKTGIEVDVATGYTVKDMADAIKLAVETAEAFYGTVCVDESCILLEAPTIGPAKTAPADVDTGFTVSVGRAGLIEDLGKTKEGITVTFEATTFDVNANQTGTLLLDQIIQGTSASMEMSLLEVSKERMETIIGEGFGDVYTPAGGTSLVGFGTSKNFQSSFESAGKLVLHPIRLADSDKSEDVTFWKTLPLPSSINYDGTDTKALSVTFNALADESKPKEISVFAVGDSSQYLA